MTSKMVSVIVPIYKAEKYMDRCIKSIASQTYKNLEIILVDDGSPDRCPFLCDQWAQRDERIKVIHKPNGGVSSARNAGLEFAVGEFVFFVDSDDYLAENALKSMVDLQQKYHADLVVGSFLVIEKRKERPGKIYNERYILREHFAEHLSFVVNGLHSACWGKLYISQIIKEHKISFPVGIPRGEDSIFTYQYLSCVSSIATTDQCIYFYDLTPEGSAVKKYFENIHYFAEPLFEVQKAFVASVEGADIGFVRQLEMAHFEYCLGHFALYETNCEKLTLKIQETVKVFPESVKHEVFGRDIQKKKWMRAARKWRMHNIKWYMKTVIQRAKFLIC